MAIRGTDCTPNIYTLLFYSLELDFTITQSRTLALSFLLSPLVLAQQLGQIWHLVVRVKVNRATLIQ